MQSALKRIGFYISLTLAALSGALAYHYFTRNVAQADAPHAEMSLTAPARSPLISATQATPTYICPMHTHVVQDHPGTCPICGMELVKTGAHEHADVIVDSATQQKLGVRVAAAVEQRLTRQVQTHGTVNIDQSTITHMNPKYEGWIRKLHVKAVGERVRAGDVIYEIYSPDLIVRQRDYLKLVERRIQLRKMLPDPGATENETVMMLAQESLRARQRLFYEDIDADVLREIESRKEPLDIVPVRAPRDGVITEIGAREGSFVRTDTNIVALADLARVWIDITLYEDQLHWVKDGDALTAHVDDPAAPEFTGRLRIASALLDAQTRTVRARLEVANPRGVLRPGQYAEVTVQAQAHQGVAVPRTALLRTGAGELVMRHSGDGHFIPTPVHSGVESTAWVEIRDGLQAGDEVAVNGQFLLAAEASVQDALARMVSAK
jgi:Cu(I)/Ag(I) efflux system membrane fusion protein